MLDKVSKRNIGSKKPLLIFIPFAGGSFQAYYMLQRILDNVAEIECIDYAGHGKRHAECLAKSFTDLIDDMSIVIQKVVKSHKDCSVVIFGHSMGALALGHAAKQLYDFLGERLKGIIISSCLPPNKFCSKTVSECKDFINDEKLIDYLALERNIPYHLLESREFMQLIFPAIKNDMRILSEYQYQSLCLPPVQVHCIWGTQDYGIDRKNMDGWQKYSETQIFWHSCVGTHFYFEEHTAMAAGILEHILNQCLNKNTGETYDSE